MAVSEIALYYRVFFLIIEPISALAGAVCAGLYPSQYLALTEQGPSASNVLLPQAVHVSLRQLANMYLLFALNEALILRITADRRVWTVLLVNLLIADIGHLYSVAPLGPAIYYDVTRWNAMDWGNIAFVYLGMTSRICFLAGWGIKVKRA